MHLDAVHLNPPPHSFCKKTLTRGGGGMGTDEGSREGRGGGGGGVGAWAAYQRALRRRPLQTKALTAAAVQGWSDILAQLLTRRPGGALDLRKALKMAAFGLVWGGPSIHFWQRFMEEVAFRGARPGLRTVLVKTVLDQMTYGPLQNLAFMSFIALAVEGRSLAALRRRVRENFWGVQLNGWKVWPLAALVNYRYVPVPFRAAFANLVALCWSIFLITRGANGAAPRLPPAPKAA